MKLSAAFIPLLAFLLASCGSSSQAPPEGSAVPSPTAAAAPIQATGASASLKRLSGEPTYNLEVMGPVVNPLASKGIIVPASGPLQISGWAVDAAAKALGSGVDIVIDGVPVAAQYSMDRLDVARALKVPAYGKAGFQLTMQPGQVRQGSHTIAVRVVSSDGAGYYEGTTIPFTVQ
jgi:hypothetical protein